MYSGRRVVAILVIAFGLYSFFLPMLVLKKPVLGRTEWTPFAMAEEVHNGRLPVDKHWIELPAVEDAISYVLLLLALLAVIIPGGASAFRAIALLGFCLSAVATRRAVSHYSYFLTGSYDTYYRGGASWGPALYLLPISMVLLAIIAVRNFPRAQNID